MITKTEADKNGKALRVYHRAGSLPGRGADEKFAWTHAADDKTKAECVACQSGNIPQEVKESPR